MSDKRLTEKAGRLPRPVDGSSPAGKEALCRAGPAAVVFGGVFSEWYQRPHQPFTGVEMSDLFSWTGRPRAKVRTGDPDTSIQAADSVKMLRASQSQILDAFNVFGQMTDEELIGRMLVWGIKISPSGCRSRRHELVEMRRVIDSGERKLTKSGRKTIVWKLAPCS